MTISRILMATIMLGLLAACSIPHPDMKSPCVGNDGSPCGPRRDVNGWWLKNAEQS